MHELLNVPSGSSQGPDDNIGANALTNGYVAIWVIDSEITGLILSPQLRKDRGDDFLCARVGRLCARSRTTEGDQSGAAEGDSDANERNSTQSKKPPFAPSHHLIERTSTAGRKCQVRNGGSGGRTRTDDPAGMNRML